MKKIHSAISKGLTFLAAQQQDNGSFLTYSSRSSTDFTHAYTFRTTFSSSLILSALTTLFPDKQADSIANNIAHFLLKQKNHDWSWNYWDRSTQEAKEIPYPDDLDDTFCAATALLLFNKKLITGNGLACLTKLLTQMEQRPGGPYRTWIVSGKSPTIWHDHDCVVNANIAYFLSLQGITLPPLTIFLEKNIQISNLTSPYYPTPYPFLYFLARWYRGEKVDLITSFLMKAQQTDSTWGTPLDTALAFNALLLLHTKVLHKETIVHSFLRAQQTNGSWDASCFYTGVNPSGTEPYYGGSRALTTALCIEALNRYQLQSMKRMDQSKGTVRLFPHIIQKMHDRFRQLAQPLQKTALAYLHNLQQKDSLIFLLPASFAESLSEDIDDDLIRALGTANAYGWIAYTIYDDFFDDEPNIELLSLANLCLREVTTIYTSLFYGKPFLSLFQTIMDEMDNANQRELLHNGFSEVKELSKKSFGHALGPMAIIASLGYSNTSEEMTSLRKFFHHYLVAKQLHDDAHDVFDDLQQKKRTPAIHQLHRDYAKQYPQGDLLLEKEETIRKVFWETTLPNMCRTILFHCRRAKHALRKIQHVVRISPLEQLLLPFESAARRARDEQKQTREFLRSY